MTARGDLQRNHARNTLPAQLQNVRPGGHGKRSGRHAPVDAVHENLDAGGIRLHVERAGWPGRSGPAPLHAQGGQGDGEEQEAGDAEPPETQSPPLFAQGLVHSRFGICTILQFGGIRRGGTRRPATSDRLLMRPVHRVAGIRQEGRRHDFLLL